MEKEKNAKTADGNTSVKREKSCFIITPVGTPLSSTRRFADGVINSCIKPVLEGMGFRVTVPHELATPGSITKDVISKIINYELVVANLTDLNPNVMYELGIRHSARKPIVHICEEGTDLPFDIGTDRTLFYRNDMFGVEEMKPKFKEFIETALETEKPSNPVYDAIGLDAVLLDIENRKDGDNKDGLNILKYILKELESMKKNNNIDNYLFDNKICFGNEKNHRIMPYLVRIPIPYDVANDEYVNDAVKFFTKNNIKIDSINISRGDLIINFYDVNYREKIDNLIDIFISNYSKIK